MLSHFKSKEKNKNKKIMSKKDISNNPNSKELKIPFTMVPNFALDTMAMRTPAEDKVYFAIIRQTYGYVTEEGNRKKSAWLSVSRLIQITGLSKQGVLNARKSLFKNDWIFYKMDNGKTRYAIVDRSNDLTIIKQLESTEFTDSSKVSRLEESTELTEASQVSLPIKETVNKTFKEKEKEDSLSYMNLKSRFAEKLKSKSIQYIDSRKEYGSISLMQELKIEPQEIIDMVDILEQVKRNNPSDKFLQGICFTMSHFVSYRANIYNAFNKINGGMSLEQLKEIEEENKIWM